jgi:hypothetical protein
LLQWVNIAHSYLLLVAQAAFVCVPSMFNSFGV